MTSTIESTIPLTPAAEAYLGRVYGGVDTLDVEWTSTVKPAAAHKGVTLTKVVSATVLTGVEYPKLRVNAERETGELPWGQWAVYPWLIWHAGTWYARLNTVDGTLKTTHFVDGLPVSREDFESYLTPSGRAVKRPHGGTITVKLDNLTIL